MWRLKLPNSLILCVLFSHAVIHGDPPLSNPTHDQLYIWSSNSSLYSWPKSSTNQHGNPIPSLVASQTVGPRGHVLLQDHHLIEELAHFNRERIPERVVHAKGAGAHGFFEVTHDISHYTKADFLNGIGKKTPTFVRMSTAVGPLGSADTDWDMHGFATKFRTQEGNHDLLCISTEVLGVRDPRLFAAINRSRKRNPVTNKSDWNGFWDFIALRPETTFHTLLIFSYFGRPDGYRRMDGFAVNTFQLVNSHGDIVFARFRWRTLQKIKTLSVKRAFELVAENPEYKTEDLYNAIEKGDYPKWELMIQVMTLDRAKSIRWNPFDTTRLWRAESFPWMPVGIMTLNRNPENFFAEVEQSAFNPANMVPGIESSPDKLLHARLFAYQDTQNYRLGVNHAQLPINRPLVEVNTYHRNGPACFGNNGGGSPNYFPNSYGGSGEARGVSPVQFTLQGIVDRYDDPQDEYELPRLFVNKDLTEEQRKEMVGAIADRLKEAHPELQERVLQANFYPISKELGDEIRHATEDAREEAQRKRRFQEL